MADRIPPAELLDRILDETGYAFELGGPRRRQAWENLKKVRALVRRGSAPVEPEPHAEALKTKLAEAREVADDREEFESAETPVDQAESVPLEVGDRRASVHERGRQVAEQMRRGSPES